MAETKGKTGTVKKKPVTKSKTVKGTARTVKSPKKVTKKAVKSKKVKDDTSFILEATEKAKMELSSTLQTEINLPYITVIDNEPKHLEVKLTRAKLEEIIAPIVHKTENPCKQALKDAKLKPADIDHIVLVGGTTRIPLVIKLVEKIFGIIGEIKKQGTTILLVEQNAYMALKAADRGYVIETGSVVMDDEAGKLLDDPKVKEAYLGE